MKRRSLGRGLDVLLGLAALPDEPVAATPPPPTDTLYLLPIEQLTPNRYQPRQTIAPDRLNALADSIRAQGIVQPIVARRLSESDHETRYYEIIAGERRWRAAKIAGLTQVPVLVRDVSEQAAMVIALIENMQREDLNPLEEATALKRLLDEFHLTHQQIADAIGYSRAAVSNLLRLLELHPEVQQWVIEKKLDRGHARALLSLDLQQQPLLARQVMEQGWSVRETEQQVRQWHQEDSRSVEPTQHADRTSEIDPEHPIDQPLESLLDLPMADSPVAHPMDSYLLDAHQEATVADLTTSLTPSPSEPAESFEPSEPFPPPVRSPPMMQTQHVDATPPGLPTSRSSESALQDPNIQRLQDRLSDRLGARVLIQKGSSGKGRIVIHYNSLDELDGILTHVKVSLDD